MKSKLTHVFKRLCMAFALILALFVAACAWYVSDYAHADQTAQAAIAQDATSGVEVRTLEDGSIAFVHRDATTGLVFYPGAKVEPEAYAPLLRSCAEQGMTCVLVRPLFNLAILSMDAAKEPMAQFPQINSWVLCGHSMGGVAAADYVSKHTSDVDALVLLASYPACDLSQYEGKVLTLVGSNDHVINRENMEAARDKLPPSASMQTIEGGNHASFGNYGEQSGDGVSTIGTDAQQAQTVEAIVRLLDS